MTTSDVLSPILQQLDKVSPSANGAYVARCPAHDDRDPSLSIAVGRNGKPLLHCFAGCSYEEIIGALGESHFAPLKSPNPRIVATTDYELIDGGSGELVAIHRRFDHEGGGKHFGYFRDGRSGLQGRPTSELPLYGLTDAMKADSGSTVVLTEGEKARNSLAARGVLSVGSACGAIVTPADEQLRHLSPYRVRLWPDNDDAGRQHMSRIGERLLALGTEVSWVDWAEAPAKGDAADFVGDVAALHALLDEAHLLESAGDAEWPSLSPKPTGRPEAPAHPTGTELPAQRLADRLKDGATWLSGADAQTSPIWGDQERALSLWEAGEPCILAGPSGVGKTTITGQLILGSLGLVPDVLGFPVAPAEGLVLLISADRPRQAVRSFARMFHPEHQERVRERLRVWEGPLPFDIGKEPEQFIEFLREIPGVTRVFIDSLKDVAFDLSKDEVGSRVNSAHQDAVAAGYDIFINHHQRKATSGGGKPNSLADVYGSTWITAGAGSVVLLWGEPGSPIVELTHLKQPADQVGPLQIVHDHETGHSSVVDTPDLLAIVRASPMGISAREAASLSLGKEDLSKGEIERFRARLKKLEKKEQITPRDITGDTRWVAVSNRHEDHQEDRQNPHQEGGQRATTKNESASPNESASTGASDAKTTPNTPKVPQPKLSPSLKEGVVGGSWSEKEILASSDGAPAQPEAPGIDAAAVPVSFAVRGVS